MPDERDETKKITGKNNELVKVIVLIALIIVVLVDIFIRFVYPVIGPYDYSIGNKELREIIPNAIEFFWNNEDEFRRIASEITDNEVIGNLNISQENFKVTSAYERGDGVYFHLLRIDLSDLLIVYNPNFEDDLRFLSYCMKFSDDWYICIWNSPRT